MIDRVMGSRACSDVEVAVLMVGLQDALQIRDAAALVALAVRALRGGSVCMCWIMGSDRSMAFWFWSGLNVHVHTQEEDDGASNVGFIRGGVLGRVQEEEENKEGEGSSSAIAAAAVQSGGNDNDAAATTGEEIEIVGNLRAIVEYLAKERGVHVVLCTLPLVGAPTSVRARAVAGINRRIVAMAKRSVSSHLTYIVGIAASVDRPGHT